MDVARAHHSPIHRAFALPVDWITLDKTVLLAAFHLIT